MLFGHVFRFSVQQPEPCASVTTDQGTHGSNPVDADRQTPRERSVSLKSRWLLINPEICATTTLRFISRPYHSRMLRLGAVTDAFALAAKGPPLRDGSVPRRAFHGHVSPRHSPVPWDFFALNKAANHGESSPFRFDIQHGGSLRS